MVSHPVALSPNSSLNSPLSSWPRLLRVFLGVGLAFALSACGSGGGSGGDVDDGDGDGASDDDGADGGGPPPPSDGGIVIEQVPLIEGLTTLAGVGIAGVQDGDRNNALFNNPVNLVMTPDGDFIVADFDNSLIRRVTPAGDVATINLEPTTGVFRRPFGLFISDDTLYIQTDGNSLGRPTDMGAGALWRMPLDGGSPELVRDVPGRSRGMVELPDGRIAMAFYQQHTVQIWDPISNTLTADFAGMNNTPAFADAQSTAARFNAPYDMIVLDDGSLLVSDFSNHRLRRVDMQGNVTTFAGTGVAGRDDGPLATATFNAPQGLAKDAAGNIYVTDTGSYLVRRISPDGQVTTIAGNGSAGYTDSEDPLAGQLYGVEGIDVGNDGYLYIADGTRGEPLPYHRIRRLTLQ